MQEDGGITAPSSRVNVGARLSKFCLVQNK